ncbi:MAG: hypothetical protein SOV73_00345 [Candidatus Faecivivens sp.]|nr:hypothetical protein [Candidatus Faecivivens sp.]
MGRAFGDLDLPSQSHQIDDLFDLEEGSVSGSAFGVHLFVLAGIFLKMPADDSDDHLSRTHQMMRDRKLIVRFVFCVRMDNDPDLLVVGYLEYILIFKHDFSPFWEKMERRTA